MADVKKTGIADINDTVVTESMADYAGALEASFRKIKEGDIVTGTVIAVNETGVILDLSYYAQGVIAAQNMSKDPAFHILTDVHKDDVIKATVIRLDDGEGNIVLSKVEANESLGWDKLVSMQNEGAIVSVRVSEAVNKGVTAYLEGIRGFIPASGLALDYVEDTESFVGKTLQVKIIDVDPAKGKLILSAKAVLKEQEAERLRHKVSMLIPGSILEGRVESLTAYGAFIDLGDGLNGLVHISQICEKRIRKPSEVLAVNDSVKVKVLNTNDGKISLSIRAAKEEEAPDEMEEQMAKEYSSNESIGTSLGDLFKNLKI